MSAALGALRDYVTAETGAQARGESTVLLSVTHSNLRSTFMELRFDLHVRARALAGGSAPDGRAGGVDPPGARGAARIVRRAAPRLRVRGVARPAAAPAQTLRLAAPAGHPHAAALRHTQTHARTRALDATRPRHAAAAVARTPHQRLPHCCACAHR
jgi:hypothetical protein